MSVSFCAIRGNGDYLTRHLAEERYRYLESDVAAESAGLWHGGGARHFGIEGKRVEQEPYKNLIQGFSPDGTQKLTQNAGERYRAPGWEAVVAPHKSVSDLLTVLSLERWQEITSCHNEAVRLSVIAPLEEQFGFSRRGKGGAIRERAELIIGEHLHLTNRENEPQIHTHLTIMNGGLRDDGTFGALVSKYFYERQRFLNAAYHQTLARLLRERVGIVCDRDGFAARVRGVPEPLIETTSTRSAQIEAAVGPKESRSPKSAQIAALTTRKEKELKLISVLAEEWGALARKFKFHWEQVVRREPRAISEATREKIIERAIRTEAKILVDEAPVFDRWQLLTRVITSLIGKDIEYTQAMETVSRALERPQEHGLVDLGTQNHEKAYTTSLDAHGGETG